MFQTPLITDFKYLDISMITHYLDISVRIEHSSLFVDNTLGPKSGTLYETIFPLVQCVVETSLEDTDRTDYSSRYLCLLVLGIQYLWISSNNYQCQEVILRYWSSSIELQNNLFSFLPTTLSLLNN